MLYYINIVCFPAEENKEVSLLQSLQKNVSLLRNCSFLQLEAPPNSHHLPRPNRGAKRFRFGGTSLRKHKKPNDEVGV